MALINKKLTELDEKLSVSDDAWIHVVEPLDLTQSPQGSSYKAKKSTISGTVKAQSTVSGTVKTNSNSADPIVYLKSEVDALIVGKENALGFTPENIANKQNNLSVDITNTKYPTVSAVNLGLSDKATTADLLLKADKTSTYTKAEVDNLDAQVLIDANVYTDSKVTSLYKIMPSVANFASLPLIDNEVGDVRNVIDTGMNYVWDGVLWDALGSTVDISGKEDVANKQNSLAVDATNLKYPTVTAVNTGLALKANIASPTFTGTPTAPTATAGTNTTQIATTAFVSAADAGNVKLTGEQTIAGNKIFVNTGTTPSVINSVSGSSAADAGITGRASAAGTIGIRATAIVGAQAALKITSNQAGSAGSITPLLLIENVLSGNDMTPIKIVTYGTEVARVSHLGAYTGTSFIKSGATSTNILLAGGGDIARNTAFNKNFGTTAGTVVEGGTLGSNAYTSTAYLPLSGGALTGVLTIPTKLKFQSEITDTFSHYINPGKWEWSTGISFDSGDYIISRNDGLGTPKLRLNSIGDIFITGTVTSSPATLSNQVVVKSQLDAVKPYKVYTALLTQTGTSAPTATVLENTLGGTIVWSYSATGVYVATLSGAFTSSKTAIQLQNTSNTGVVSTFTGTSNFVSIATYDSIGTSANGKLTEAFFEIRVYN